MYTEAGRSLSQLAREIRIKSLAIRRQLAARVSDIEAMTPAEIRDFVQACREAAWLGNEAKLFDERMEL